VDLFCATGQFANLIHIADGNTFQVNGETVSSVWAPQAVVTVEIVQETNGIQVRVVRTTNGVEDLNVSTNILQTMPLTGLGFYCGGYSCAPADNPNYALFVNNLRIEGDRPGVTNAGMAANNQFRLEWPAEAGLLYRVETTPDVLEVPWSNATPARLVFTTADGVCELPMDGPRRFFYRFAADRPTATGDYLVVDISLGPEAETWPVSYLDAVPPGGWTDEYKTTKLVLRRIPAGTFTMGSPASELGRDSDEPHHVVTLTKDFYVGVFEVTQKQWYQVMGVWTSYFTNAVYRETRPVERVSYNDIRGTVAGTNWPADGNVDVNSFIGRLRAKTGQAFDLPTEAQWEYACRAGTTNTLNNNMDLTSISNCPNVTLLGRYWYNGGSGYSANGDDSVGSAKVGSYQANAWGLHDMHGNQLEWCLDWYESAPAGALDPSGAVSGWYRVLRGGSWLDNARFCRSADRLYGPPGNRYSHTGGLRVLLPLGRP
jgi:formylglycine-generating enzyme required for sulfatase activity